MNLKFDGDVLPRRGLPRVVSAEDVHAIRRALDEDLVRDGEVLTSAGLAKLFPRQGLPRVVGCTHRSGMAICMSCAKGLS